MATTDNPNMAVEIAALRGEMREGFALLAGRLDLLVERTNGTRADVEALEARVSALEARRWPLAPIAAVSGLVSAIVAISALLVR